MRDCEIAIEKVNIFVNLEDNPNLKFIELEMLGFVPCLKNIKTNFTSEWVKSTWSDNRDILLQMRNCGVSQYTIVRPDDRFLFPTKVTI